MDDTGKPFACPSPGCNMSFTNEDHLTVHKKKHDMILNFGMNGKGSAFIADQTPTPTRFIRNCEEVGLFQDLQSVNPFEETFRRAVEAGKSGSVSVSEIESTDDTLHTPHIFPHIVESSSTNQDIPQTTIVVPPKITVTETSNERSSTKTKVRRSRVRKKNSHAEVVKKLKITTTCTNSIQTTERIVVQKTNTMIVPKVPAVQAPTPLSINGEEVQLLLKTSDGKLLQLSAAPVNESQSSINNTNAQRVIFKTEPPVRATKESAQKTTEASKLSNAKMKLKQALTKGLAETVNEKTEKIHEKVKVSSPSKENRKKNIEQFKKQDVLERNRASSMRCRAKRKAWIQELETTVKDVNDRNNCLQTEVKSLRSEVAKLKALLLAHKDCPITKAMEKGNSIVVGSKLNIIPANANIVPGISTITDGSMKRTSFPIEVPIVSTKLLLSTEKNAMILPNDKSGNKITGALPRSRLFKKLPALKITDVDPVIINERDEQFLVLQSSPSNLSELTSRGIIEINPVIHIENAASKITGT